MGHSFTCNKIHIVFSTDGRKKTIPEDKQTELWAYIGGIARNKGSQLVKAGGVEDHIHVIVELPPDMAVSQCVQAIKANTSRWMKQCVRTFAWQSGYAAFSVSQSMALKTIRYIANQKQHHKKMSFEMEWKELVRLNGATRPSIS